MNQTSGVYFAFLIRSQDVWFNNVFFSNETNIHKYDFFHFDNEVWPIIKEKIHLDSFQNVFLIIIGFLQSEIDLHRY